MLTGYQCEVIAFVTDGGIICRDCAVKRYSTITVEKAERGLDHAFHLDPLIRYSVDEIAGEYASEHANEEIGSWEDNPEAWDAAFEAYPGVCCDDCMEVID